MSSQAGISSCRAVSSASSGMTPSSFWRAKVLSRKASASPATGSSKKHQGEQVELVAAAFTR